MFTIKARLAIPEDDKPAKYHTQNKPSISLEDAEKLTFDYQGQTYHLSTCEPDIFKKIINYQGTDRDILKILAQKELDACDRWYVLNSEGINLFDSGNKKKRKAKEIAERKKKALLLLFEGMSREVVASVCGLPLHTVSRYVNQHGLYETGHTSPPIDNQPNIQQGV